MVLTRELVVALRRIHGHRILSLKLHSQNGFPLEQTMEPVFAEIGDCERVGGYTVAIPKLGPLTSHADYAAGRISSNLKGSSK